MNNAHSWKLDGAPIDVADEAWRYNATAEGGLDVCEIKVSESEIAKLPMLPIRTSVLEGSHEGTVKYLGELTAPPRYDEGEGMWHLSADGERREADMRSQGLLFQSRDAESIRPSDSSPHGYVTADGIRSETEPGLLIFRIERGETIATGALGRALNWFPSRLVPPSRLAADIRKNRNSSEHRLQLRTGDGPSGAMAQDGATVSLGSGGPASFDRDLTDPSDQVEFAVEVVDSGVTLANNRTINGDEDITLKGTGPQNGGTHKGSAVSIDDHVDEIAITLNVSAASGSNLAIETEIQTSKGGSDGWHTVGTIRRGGSNGSTTITVSDNLRDKMRYVTKITGTNPSYTYSVTGVVSPVRVVAGSTVTLDGDVTSAELTLYVDAFTGNGKELEVEIQSAGSGDRHWRTVGQFDTMNGTGQDTITVNCHKRLRFLARVYGTSEPSVTFDILGVLGYKALTVKLGQVRVNGISAGDSETIQDAMVYVADALGWDASRVSDSLSLNCLPLDWLDNWREFFTYLSTALIDGWWGKWPEGLEAGLWSEAETVHLFASDGAFPELAPLDTYDDVLVEWENAKGVQRHFPRITDPALRYYPVRLNDIQSNDALAEQVHDALFPDVTELRYHGRIRVTHAYLTAGGLPIPAADVRPGMKAILHDFGPLRAETLRITDVQYDADGAWLGCDDMTTDERYQNRARIKAERKAGRMGKKR